jgi:hypothetical protein
LPDEIIHPLDRGSEVSGLGVDLDDIWDMGGRLRLSEPLERVGDDAFAVASKLVLHLVREQELDLPFLKDLL